MSNDKRGDRLRHSVLPQFLMPSMNLPCFRLISPPPRFRASAQDDVGSDVPCCVFLGLASLQQYCVPRVDDDDGRLHPFRAGVRPPGRPHLARQRKRPKKGGGGSDIPDLT